MLLRDGLSTRRPVRSVEVRSKCLTRRSVAMVLAVAVAVTGLQTAAHKNDSRLEPTKLRV